MVCQKCGIRTATVHLTNIINGTKSELHLCEGCAREKESIMVKMGVNDLMSGFFGIKPQDDRKTLQCEFCGSTQKDISKRGKAGCEHCYEVFGEYLIPIIRKVHGTDTHAGKQPEYQEEAGSGADIEKPVMKAAESTAPSKNDTLLQLERLEQEMKEAIGQEDYEKAALLRDQIKNLKEKEGLDK